MIITSIYREIKCTPKWQMFLRFCFYLQSSKLTRLIHCFVGSHNARVKAVNLLEYFQRKTLQRILDAHTKWSEMTGQNTLHTALLFLMKILE